MYMAKGVHQSKIVIGCPLYGRAFTNTQGPGTPFQGVGEGSWENGVWDWKALPRPGSSVHEDGSLGASWGFGGNTMVSYDTLNIAQQKAEWVKQKGWGGLMWWESSGDKPGSEGMIATQVGCLGALEQSENTCSYPKSKYDNLRNEFR